MASKKFIEFVDYGAQGEYGFFGKVVARQDVTGLDEAEAARLIAEVRYEVGAHVATRTVEEMPSMKTDRPHRWPVGALVRHIDSEPDDPKARCRIVAQTWRMVEGVNYPTYTLKGDDGYGGVEVVDDVLDTDDLVPER